MQTASYNFLINPEIKLKAETTFSEFGVNLDDAINIFLHMAVKFNGFPFELRNKQPNEQLRNALAEADVILADSSIIGFSSIEEMNAAMDAEDAKELEEELYV